MTAVPFHKWQMKSSSPQLKRKGSVLDLNDRLFLSLTVYTVITVVYPYMIVNGGTFMCFSLYCTAAISANRWI
jgi:hypothetical protein